MLLNDPEATVRPATRAHQTRPDVAATTMLAAARAEAGRPALARQTLDAVAGKVRTDEDRYRCAAEDFSLALWSERDPDRAWAVLQPVRAELPEPFQADLLGPEAMLLLFTGRCAEVLPAAGAALAAAPTPSAQVRA